MSRHHLHVKPQISLHSFVNEGTRLRSETMDSITHSTASNMSIDISTNFPLMLSSLGMRIRPIDMSQKTPEGRKPEYFIIRVTYWSSVPKKIPLLSSRTGSMLFILVRDTMFIFQARPHCHLRAT